MRLTGCINITFLALVRDDNIVAVLANLSHCDDSCSLVII